MEAPHGNPALASTGACSGDTMSLLTADSPPLVRNGTLDILWHPSSAQRRPAARSLIAAIEAGTQTLDILCIEGSLITGPFGTGMFDSYRAIRAPSPGGPAMVAVGTCSAFGGIPAARPTPPTAPACSSTASAPAACCRPTGAPRRAAGDQPGRLPDPPDHHHPQPGHDRPGPALDDLNRPRPSVQHQHQGCTRNEYHEYDLEETQFGGRGCLFFNLGCQGPNTLANCNSELWNRRSSKRRRALLRLHLARLPRDGDLFRTENRRGAAALPLGVSRAQYMAYKNLAHAAMPARQEPGWSHDHGTTLDIDLNRVEGDLEFQVDLDGNASWTPAASAPCSAASSSS
jgi:hydrogenase small subunit